MELVRRVVGNALLALGVGATIGRPGRAPGAAGRTLEEEDERLTEEGVPDTEGSAGGFFGRVDRIQRRHVVLGFPVAVIKRYAEDGAGRLAAVVAYYGFFSVFPALLAFVTISGFVLDHDPELRDRVVASAVGEFPVVGQELDRGGLSGNGAALAAGLGAALWAGFGAMVAAQHALNEVWDVPRHDRPNPVQSRARALLMFVVFGVGLVTATVVTNIVNNLDLPIGGRLGLTAANLAINIAIIWLAFQILVDRAIPWRSLLPGAVVGGIVYYGLQQLGSLVVERYVRNAGDTYGTFATVIGLLTWFHLLAQGSILAAEINVVRSRRLYPRSLTGELTNADRRALLGHLRSARRDERFPPRR